MNVLFIVPYPTEGPSNRFRVEQYLPELRREGIKYTIRPFCNSSFYKILQKRGFYIKKLFNLILFSCMRLFDLIRSLNYDVIFIHREAFPAKNYIFEAIFSKMGKVLIYDFDDSVFLKKPSKIKKILSVADSVIAGNSFLEDYAIKFGKNINVLPTCIDADKYIPSSKPKSKNKIVVGWIGTPSTSLYLSGIKEVFKILSNKYKNLEFQIIGAYKPSVEEGVPFVNKTWSLDSEIEDLQEFDIGIMPMPDNDWTVGKCAFKIIQYMAVGIPAVASPVGMNKEVIKDGVNGFFASTCQEWCEKLSTLIESSDLRENMGENGRRTIEERYSLKINAPRFLNILKKALKEKK